MSKLTLFLAVPTIVGLGSLAAWNLSLQAELDDLRDRSVQTAERVEEASAAADHGTSGPSMSERTSARLRQLESRLSSVESGGAAQHGPRSNAGSGSLTAESAESADDAVANLAASLKDAPDAEFKARVYAALDEREERRRQERQEREAARMAERMLRGIEATDQQVAQVSAAMLDYFGKRDGLRGQQDLEPELKRTAFKELTDARNTTIEAIVGAEAYAEIKKRTERRDDEGRQRGRNPRNDRKKRGDAGSAD